MYSHVAPRLCKLLPFGQTARESLSLAFIDAGMVTELSPRDHEHMAGILGALFRFDGRKAAELIADNAAARAVEQAGGDVDAALLPDMPRFFSEVEKLAEAAKEQTFMCNVHGF